MKAIYLISVIIIISFIGCNIGAGNIGSIISFTSNIKTEVVNEITDTLRTKGGFYSIPDSLNHLNSIHYDHLDCEIYFFDTYPKEAYYVELGWFCTIRHVYSCEQSKWLNRETDFSDEDYKRFKHRMVEILEDVSEEAKKLNYPIRDIYYDTTTYKILNYPR